MPLEVRQIGIRLAVDDGADAANDDDSAAGEDIGGIDPAERASIVAEAVSRVIAEIDRRGGR